MFNYHGRKILNSGCVYSTHTEKLTYQRQKITTQQQERFVQTEINIALGKKEGYMHSILGSRLISVDRQAVSETKFLQFDNFNSVSSKA